MKKYRIKLNDKVYEVELEEVLDDIVKEKKEGKTINFNSNGKKQKILAPMSGTLLSIKVKEGQEVNKGEVVAILEAMKMENEILASNSGIVKEIFVSEKQKVESQESLMIIE